MLRALLRRLRGGSASSAPDSGAGAANTEAADAVEDSADADSGDDASVASDRAEEEEGSLWDFIHS